MRLIRLVAVAVALAASLAAPTAASASGSGAEYGACISMHATTMGGFSGDHNPGMHQGFSSWPGCPGA